MITSPLKQGFLAALRRIENLRRDLPRIGRAATPDDEAVRLGQEPGLAFEAAQIVSWQQLDTNMPARIGVSFFGVFGPNGPLPLHLTEQAYQRRHQYRDAAFSRFVDVFHHRLLTFFYRAWAETQPTVSRDRADDDRFGRLLGALVGQRTASADDAADEIDELMLAAAGHLTNQTRHAEGLAKLLAAAFHVPAHIEELVGSWLPVPDEYCWRLDTVSLGTGQPMGTIGQTTRVGTEVWDCQSKFRVVLGPLRRVEHERFQPGSTALAQLVAVVRRYAGPELTWELRLMLDEPERKPAVLGSVGAIGRTAHRRRCECELAGPGARSARRSGVTTKQLDLENQA